MAPPLLLRVGQLARRTGLTVRTLHFYDEIGLLKPSDRSEGDHRLYGAADVARLQRITSLRALGLTLEEIGDLLDGREGVPTTILHRHIDHLRGQIRRVGELVGRLERLAARLDDLGEPSVEDLLTTIKETVMVEQYFTAEQIEAIKSRRDGIAGPEAWAALVAEVRAAQASGLSPEDPAVLALAQRMDDMQRAITGGDPGVLAGLRRMWHENREALMAQSGFDRAALDFLNPARALLKAGAKG